MLLLDHLERALISAACNAKCTDAYKVNAAGQQLMRAFRQ
jgi:hypothetical protein